MLKIKLEQAFFLVHMIYSFTPARHLIPGGGVEGDRADLLYFCNNNTNVNVARLRRSGGAESRVKGMNEGLRGVEVG